MEANATLPTQMRKIDYPVIFLFSVFTVGALVGVPIFGYMYGFNALDWVMLATEYTIMDHPQYLIDFVSELESKNISVINSAVFHGDVSARVGP